QSNAVGPPTEPISISSIARAGVLDAIAAQASWIRRAATGMMRLSMACSRSEMVDRSKTRRVRTNLGQRATTSQKACLPTKAVSQRRRRAPRVSARWESPASGDRILASAVALPCFSARTGVHRASLLDFVDQLGKRTGCEHAAATREDVRGFVRAEH